jgi:hypothetical protein
VGWQPVTAYQLYSELNGGEETAAQPRENAFSVWFKIRSLSGQAAQVFTH